MVGAANLSEQKQNIELLMQAFSRFTEASTSLEAAYQELQHKADQLSIELEQANRQLQLNLAEKERVKNYLHNILESLANGVLVIDTDGQMKLCNRAACALLGISEGPVATDISVKEIIGSHPIYRLIDESLVNPRTQTEMEMEIARDGGRSLILSASSSPVIDSEEQIKGINIIIRDITKLRELEQQSKRAERLSAMGEMAVELAHEIRNPLGSIELFASLLNKQMKGEGPAGQWAQQIVVGVRSLNNIISNMLAFSRAAEPQLAPVNLLDLVDETISFIEPIIRQRRIKLKREFVDELIFINGDREMLKQVFLNLLFNGLQALPEEGALSVTVGIRQGFAQVSIEDTGVGIAPENLKRIFDPFFTTSRRGTGLGLSVAHRIIKQHAGEIEVKSEVGKGSTFTVIIPRQGKAATELQRAQR